MKRVLHLIDTSGAGGAESVFAQIVSGLDKRRFESVAAIPDPGWLYAELAAHGVLPLLTPTHGAFDVQFIRRLRGVVHAHEIDIVHAHLLTSAVYGGVVAALSRIPLVATIHGAVDLRSRFLRIKAMTVSRTAGRVVFVSDHLRRNAIEYAGFSATRSDVIHNGVDVQRFRPARDFELRRELGVQDNEILVGAVGRIVEAKGFDLLLRTAAILRDRDARYRVIIVGEPEPLGEVHARLMAQRHLLGLEETVLILNFREDMPRVYNALDVLALPSRTEGFSLVTIEAMACGLPVVATRCGGPEEIITDGIDGLLVPTESPVAIAEAIARIVRDERMRDTLGTNARARAQRSFSVDTMIRRYEAVYDSLLQSRP